MTDSEIKLKLFRLIDSQSGNILLDTYNMLKSRLMNSNKEEENYVSDIESQYKQMSKDRQRENEAMEWIEGTLNDQES